MKILSSKTPLLAAFFLVLFLDGCNQDRPTKSNPIGTNTDAACTANTTPIATVQGSGPKSDMVGQTVSVQGIITLVQPGEGIYIEEPGSDDNPRTSNAIFVELTTDQQATRTGTRVIVEGSIAELSKGRNSQTALANVNELQTCSRQQELPLSTFELPMKGLDREAIEAMRVSHKGPLTISDNYNARNGQISVSGNGIQFTATELMPPGNKANAHSGNNQSFALPLQLQTNEMGSQAYTLGASIDQMVGVMTHDDRELRLFVTSAAVPSSGKSAGKAESAFDRPPEASSDASRVVSMNLYNYFNGDGLGGDFPTPRGAKTVEDFEQQRQRIGAALHALKPELLAVMELENDGFGPNSATADFMTLLNQQAGGSWATARPENDNTGTDAIKVALFYRSDLWQAQGSARTLSGPEFQRSRQPLAQVFSPIGGGDSVLLVVNHLKSKGSCPDSGPDADQKDGQGCWSPMRKRAANIMTSWVKSLAVTNDIDNTLIMGDMNSYRREAPIDAIRDAGYEELLDSADDPPFSYVYFGQAGTLDYAFVSPSLKQKVDNAFIWQVNSIMPARMTLPQPWLRFSDHDPVVVDLLLRH